VPAFCFIPEERYANIAALEYPLICIAITSFISIFSFLHFLYRHVDIITLLSGTPLGVTVECISKFYFAFDEIEFSLTEIPFRYIISLMNLIPGKEYIMSNLIPGNQKHLTRKDFVKGS